MASNKKIYCQIKDPYVNYGIGHFVKKFGFQLADNRQKTDI